MVLMSITRMHMALLPVLCVEKVLPLKQPLTTTCIATLSQPLFVVNNVDSHLPLKVVFYNTRSYIHKSLVSCANMDCVAKGLRTKVT